MEKRFLRVPEAAKLYSVGINTMYRMAENASARVKDGKVLLIDTEKVNRYLEEGGEAMKVRCPELRYREIPLNSMGDIVKICIDNANFLAEFLALANHLKKVCKEDMSEASIADCISRIDFLFGEDTVKKYFCKEYDKQENFIPGSEQIMKFIERMSDKIVRACAGGVA